MLYIPLAFGGGDIKKSLATTYFPTPYRGSIIGVRGLDFRVRNGNGYGTSTIITRRLTLKFLPRGDGALHGSFPCGPFPMEG